MKLIEKNSRLEVHDLAVMLDVQETEVANEIAEMEKEHIICGYHTVINWGQHQQGSADCHDRGKSNTSERSGI